MFLNVHVLLVQEVLSEHVQILQGKISVLEDELQKAQSQEIGEVLGPSLDVRCSLLFLNNNFV